MISIAKNHSRFAIYRENRAVSPFPAGVDPGPELAKCFLLSPRSLSLRRKTVGIIPGTYLGQSDV
jgi:hypothetical protein